MPVSALPRIHLLISFSSTTRKTVDGQHLDITTKKWFAFYSSIVDSINLTRSSTFYLIYIFRICGMMFFCSIWRSSLRNCIDASHPWESNFPSFPSLFNKTVFLVTGFFRSAQQSFLKSVRFLLLSIQFNFLFSLATLNSVQLFSPFSLLKPDNDNVKYLKWLEEEMEEKKAVMMLSYLVECDIWIFVSKTIHLMLC